MAEKKEMSFELTTLPSGVRVVSESMEQVRSVAIGFWVRIGSRDETARQNGMSHFIEHLLFKGTPTRSARDISETFDELGAELNAFTAKEYTCLFSRVLDEHVPVAIDVLSDMLQNSRFDQKDVLSERKVVLEEINLHEDTPDERIHDLFVSALFDGHPLGKTVLGHVDTVGKFKRNDVVGFFDEAYVPANVVVAAAGNVAHQQIADLAAEHLKHKPGEPSKRAESEPKIERRVRVFPKKTEQAHICYGTEAFRSGHPDRFALSIIDSILGGGMSSRLFQEVREKRGLAYSVYSYHSLFSETGMITTYAGTTPANSKNVIQLIKKEIASIKDKGVKSEELHRAKEHLKGQMVLGLESTGRRMTRLGRIEITHGEFLTLDELVERIDAVTQEDVIRLADRLFDPSKMVLTVIGPFEETEFDDISA